MKLEIAKIVGTPTEKGWSQIHTFTPDDSQKLQKRGQLLAVISLTSLIPGIDIIAAGREVISRLHEEYYGQLEQRPIEQLKTTLGKLSDEATPEANLAITAACVVDDVLYLAIVGKGKAVLQRQGKVSQILAGSQQGVETASGYLEAGDVLLIGSEKFFEAVAWGIIQAALTANQSGEAAEIITPAVCGRSEQDLAAAVICSVEEEESETAEVAEEVFKKRPWNRELRSLRQAGDWLKNRLTRKPERSGKSLFTVALILFLLLGISVVLGSRQRQANNLQKKIAVLIDQARNKKEEAESLFSLNPGRAKELILEAQDLVSKAEAINSTDPQLVKFKEELGASALSVLREFKTEPTIFFDLGLIKEGATLASFAYTGDQLIILDKTNAAVYSLGLSDKKSSIIAGGKDLTEPSLVAVSWPKVFVVTKDGIVSIDGSTKKAVLVIRSDEEWGKTVSLQTFGGNLYLLTEKAIWQYPVTEAGFGSKRQWLKENQSDFFGVQNMAIDGSIWIQGQNGEILKFTRGLRDPFAILGLEKPFSGSSYIFNDPNQEKIYVLDSGNSRIVGLKKTGEYDSEYSWQSLGSLKGLVVNEKEGQIFLLSETKVYETKIK